MELSVEDDLERLQWEPTDEPTVYHSKALVLSEDVQELDEVPLDYVNKLEVSDVPEVVVYNANDIDIIKCELEENLRKDRDNRVEIKEDDEDELQLIKRKLEKMKLKPQYKQQDIRELEMMANGIIRESEDSKYSLVNQFALKNKTGHHDDNITLPLRFDNSQLNKYMRLEQRLDRLEKQVGNSNNRNTVSHQINDIYRRLMLIESSSSSNQELNVVDTFRNKFQQLSQEYEQSLVGKVSKQNRNEHDKFRDRFIGDEVRLQKLLRIYEMLDECADQLPLIMKRLQSYNDIENKVNDMYQGMSALQTSMREINDRQKHWMDVLDRIEHKMAEQDRIILEKLENIEKS